QSGADNQEQVCSQPHLANLVFTHGSSTLSFGSQLQPEVGGEPVRHVEPKGSCAADETHDARPLHAGRPFKGDVGGAAPKNRPAQHISHRPVCSFHGILLVTIIASQGAGVNQFLSVRSLAPSKGTALLVPFWD